MALLIVSPKVSNSVFSVPNIYKKVDFVPTRSTLCLTHVLPVLCLR